MRTSDCQPARVHHGANGPRSLDPPISALYSLSVFSSSLYTFRTVQLYSNNSRTSATLSNVAAFTLTLNLTLTLITRCMHIHNPFHQQGGSRGGVMCVRGCGLVFLSVYVVGYC